MRMAARKGEDLPEDIIKKMNKDREDTENEDQK